MSLTTRPIITDVQERLDAFEYISSQVKETIIPIPDFTTNLKDSYYTTIDGQEVLLLDSAINQLLGIGKFGIKSFKDAQRVNIKEKVNADIFMLNSVSKYADKPTYKFGVYDKQLTHTVNSKHPQLDGLAVFKAIFHQLGKLGLTPKVYDITYDPISGRQSLELVVSEWDKTTSIELNKTLAVGFKVVNSTTGHGHFRLQIYAVQLVCSNGMIAPVKVGGLELLHRTLYDLMKKARNFIIQALGSEDTYNLSLYSLNEEFYQLFAKAIIMRAKEYSSTIANALERAKSIKLDISPLKQFERIGKANTLITKDDVDKLIRIHNSDQTIDRTENTLLNIVQSMTRLANEIENPVKREKVQELAYSMIG